MHHLQEALCQLICYVAIMVTSLVICGRTISSFNLIIFSY
ncbi:hypothetical protein RDABS01_035689 [Bienertia sinuspersici]